MSSLMSGRISADGQIMSLFAVYAISLVCIGILILFAHSNKRARWSKPRSGFSQDVMLLQALWDETGLTEQTVAEEGNPAAIRQSEPLADQAEFTGQLGRLFESLERPAPVQRPAPVPRAETVERAQ